MTSSQVPSRIAIKRPFAESGLITPIQDASGDSVNYPQGFPSIYGVPASEGGKYVGRGDINAIGNIATNDLFYHKCGGINTFDANFAAKVGGYPKGAVLQYLNGNYIYNVISLVDNNKIDFTGTVPTTEQEALGIVAGSVDNSNWRYCNSDEDANDRTKIFSATGLSVIYGTTAANAPAIPLGCFVASKSGAIIPDVKGSVGREFGGSMDDGYLGTTSGEANGITGIGLVVYDLGTSDAGYSTLTFPTVTNLGSWKLIFANNLGTGITYSRSNCSINNVVANVVAMRATYGHYYAFGYFAGTVEGEYHSSYMPVTPIKFINIRGKCSTNLSEITCYID